MLQENKVLLDYKEQPVKQVLKVLKEQQEHRVLMVFREQLAKQVQ